LPHESRVREKIVFATNDYSSRRNVNIDHISLVATAEVETTTLPDSDELDCCDVSSMPTFGVDDFCRVKRHSSLEKTLTTCR